MSKQHIYKGINLRSLLEWDWARFLDWERIPWVYEPVVFRNTKGTYTPDFQVGSSPIFFEAKGSLSYLNPHINACTYPLIFALGGPKSCDILLFLNGSPSSHYSTWHAAYDAAGRSLN